MQNIKAKKMKILRILEYSMVFLIGMLVALLIFPSFVVENNLTGAVIQESTVFRTNSIKGVSTDIAAVSSLDNSGVLGKLTVEITYGNGKVLINTNPFLEPDLQYSATIAADVAQKIAIERLKDKNIIYNFDIAANVLGGGSAGAAMSIATISALLGKELKDNVVITGTIREDGVIGPVGGLIEKAQAVAENEKKIFLIPKGQGILNYYEKEIRQVKRGNFTISRTYYVPKRFDLKKYGKEELGIEVIEVETIYEVMNIMLRE